MSKFILRSNIEPLQAELFGKECCINKVTASLLLARGIDTATKVQRFFYPDVDAFTSPFLLTGMEQVVVRIKQALQMSEKVLIYADYDADGVGAGAILYLALKDLGLRTYCFVPNRKNDGYGLSIDALKEIDKKYAPDLIITVDCGITSVREVDFAKGELGIDVIVTDHHQPQDTLPNAVIINPHLEPNYPPLCGAGVALKIVHALCGVDKAMEYIDICAVSTIADMVPLISDNRIIASLGLQKLASNNARIGLRVLFNKIGIKKRVTAADISFKIAPRLNAVGRLDSAYNAFLLLTSEDRAELNLIVQELDMANKRRQELCEETLSQAKQKLLSYDLFAGGVICLEDKGWDEGIVGIVAAGICEEFCRPTIIFTHKNGILKGSARSVSGADIFAALQSAKDKLLSFGGHSMAAGVSLEKQNLPTLIALLNKYFTDTGIDFISDSKSYDYKLDFGLISKSLAKELELMQPFGLGNPRPIFLSNYKGSEFSKMANYNHIIGRLKNVTALGFNKLSKLPLTASGANILYNIELDYYRNSASPKALIKHLEQTRLPQEQILLSHYLDLYNTKDFVFSGNAKKPNEKYGHIVIAYTTKGWEQACSLYPDYKRQVFSLDCLNPINTVLLSPNMDTDISYYGKITFADILPDSFASIVQSRLGSLDYIPNASMPSIDTNMDTDILRQHFLLLKKLLSGKQDALSHLLYQNIKQLSLIEFSLAYNIFKELSLIKTDKNDIIYFSKQKTQLQASSLYLQIVKDKEEYAEVACASTE